jgi:hypothetical protein
MGYECKRCDSSGFSGYVSSRKYGALSVYGDLVRCRRCNGTGIFVSREQAGLDPRSPSGLVWHYAGTITGRTPNSDPVIDPSYQLFIAKTTKTVYANAHYRKAVITYNTSREKP